MSSQTAWAETVSRKLTRTSVLHSQSIPSMSPFWNLIPRTIFYSDYFTTYTLQLVRIQALLSQLLASPGILLPLKQISEPATSMSTWGKALGSTSNASELLTQVFRLFLMGEGHWGQENDTLGSSGSLWTHFLCSLLSSPCLLIVQGEQLNSLQSSKL